MDYNKECENAASWFGNLINATETMQNELHSLLTYLCACGKNPEDFIRDFATAHEITEKLVKKEGLIALRTLRDEILSGVFLPLSCESTEIGPDTGAFDSPEPSVSPISRKTIFSEIYVETAALSDKYPLTQEILSHFPQVTPTEIGHYKDIFNRAGQDFTAQKRSPALILAVNEGTRIYPGARPCQSFGHENFYYTSQIKNCIYDCEYCFLRGMYPSGNIVIFVNLEDYFNDIDTMLKNHPVYLSIAYDTDLPAFEGFTGLAGKWRDFAIKRPTLLIEIRTKCGSKAFIDRLCSTGGNEKPPENLILSYTISPDAVAKRFEHGAGSFSARKEAMLYALNKGMRTRLCLDPALPVTDFKKHYGEMIDSLFDNPLASKLEDISVGSFRISKSYIKNMKKCALTPISAYPYVLTDGMCELDARTHDMLIGFITGKLTEYYPPNRIFPD